MGGIMFVMVLLTVLSSAGAQVSDDWIVTQTEIGGSITINCSDVCQEGGCYPDDPIPDDYETYAWMGPAPTLTIWQKDKNITDENCPTCEIRLEGWQFHIREFQPEKHIGAYHCMLLNNKSQTYWLVKWGINMRGPYFEDLWKKYEENTIIGLSATGAFMVVAITIMLVYKYRWIPPEGEKQHSSSMTYNAYGIKESPDSQINTVFAINTNSYDRNQEGKMNPAFTYDTSTYDNVDINEADDVPAYAQVHNAPEDEVRFRSFKSQPSSSSSNSYRKSSSSSSSHDSNKRSGMIDLDDSDIDTYEFPAPPTPLASTDLYTAFDYNNRYNPIEGIMNEIQNESRPQMNLNFEYRNRYNPIEEIMSEIRESKI